MNNNIYYFFIHINLFICNRTNGVNFAVVEARESAECDTAGDVDNIGEGEDDHKNKRDDDDDDDDAK